MDRERRQYDSQIEDLERRTEDLRLLLVEEKKKYERMLRERNMSIAAATEAEMGAMRQWSEVTARDGTIVKLKEREGHRGFHQEVYHDRGAERTAHRVTKQGG